MNLPHNMRHSRAFADAALTERDMDAAERERENINTVFGSNVCVRLMPDGFWFYHFYPHTPNEWMGSLTTGERAHRESNYVGGRAAKLMWIKTCNFQLLSSWFCAWKWCFDLWRHTTGVAKSDRFMKCAGDNGACGIKHVTRINPFLHSHPLYIYTFMRFTFLNINPSFSPPCDDIHNWYFWYRVKFKQNHMVIFNFV